MFGTENWKYGLVFLIFVVHIVVINILIGVFAVRGVADQILAAVVAGARIAMRREGGMFLLAAATFARSQQRG